MQAHERRLLMRMTEQPLVHTSVSRATRVQEKSRTIHARPLSPIRLERAPMAMGPVLQGDFEKLQRESIQVSQIL